MSVWCVNISCYIVHLAKRQNFLRYYFFVFFGLATRWKLNYEQWDVVMFYILLRTASLAYLLQTFWHKNSQIGRCVHSLQMNLTDRYILKSPVVRNRDSADAFLQPQSLLPAKDISRWSKLKWQELRICGSYYMLTFLTHT